MLHKCHRFGMLAIGRIVKKATGLFRTKIIEYYQTTLEKAGFKIGVDTKPYGVIISADDEVNNRAWLYS